MRERGLTLVELLVSMTIGGIAATAVGAVLVTALRTYVRQVELGEVRANLRTAMATFTREFRPLSVGGRGGSDIVEMDNTSITYRAVRSTSFLCNSPNPSVSSVTVWRDPQAALRQLEPGRDSLLLLAENADPGPEDDEWLSAWLLGVSSGAYCPGGGPGLRLTLALSPGSDLSGVGRGAVVQGYQVTNLRLYSAADRRSWVGLRELRPGVGWSITQPILGPVSPAGLEFRYLGHDGGVANTSAEVAAIAVTVVGVGYSRIPSGPFGVAESLTFQVGLRNSPRRN